jgi:hypothetical protein
MVLSLSTALLSGCYVNLKSKIDRPVRVQIATEVPVTITNTGNSTFNEYLSKEQYVATFLLGVKGELSGTENVTIVEDNPDYMVTFDQLKVMESTSMKKIDDPDSPDHGKEFELTQLAFSAQGKVQRISDGSTRSWSASKDKSETTTSLRNAGQVLTGDNKDKDEYREKAFDSGTAEDLTQQTGRRSGVVIVRDIGNLMK